MINKQIGAKKGYTGQCTSDPSRVSFLIIHLGSEFPPPRERSKD